MPDNITLLYMIKPRVLERTIRRAVVIFPTVVVTGPRQSGEGYFTKSLSRLVCLKHRVNILLKHTI